jgi:hypothetical protein
VTSFQHQITCPHCRIEQPLAAPARDDHGSGPQDGDVSLCFDCGQVAIFDSASPGGARLPTAQEDAQLDRDPGVQLLRLGCLLRDISVTDLFEEAQGGTAP